MADPHGAPQDWIRRCYSSWMRVPDYAAPIRVRWYRVPEPPYNTPWGVGPYGSSDWDDGRSFNPPIGEQSTTRIPFVDWRDCTPPPFPPPPFFFSTAGFSTQVPIGGVDMTGLNKATIPTRLLPYPAWQFVPTITLRYLQGVASFGTLWTLTPTAKGITVSMTALINIGLARFLTFSLTWKGIRNPASSPIPIADYSTWQTITGDNAAVINATVTVTGYGPP